ncbi:SusC/RagA family TonB-linked outer membrane protein [Winogradskyella aquimaris]|uniref:SusC/RagA family TonB-linked outer membrane protein n=1 Tax=Winogradskyella aquimaris TaxID=864074 RepID=A0ABU5EQT6_9FLAO|nr:SusC/RagA family TonB-linked outer membrane protein [Winogradskyella aquimaris]MDY2588427.1 SusC/RagA family TonB-linked outer membrane protein [Winogradskyella aquimaris]
MKLKLTWLLTLFMAFVMQFSFAQEKTVTGTVTTESDGLPLPGASVIVKGTSRGAQTDFDGKYSIGVNTGDVLVISYVGYNNSEVTIGAANVYDVVLKEGNTLDEVVVVGYSKTTKESFTGTAAVVDMDGVEDKVVSNVTQSLRGEIAGVNVITRSGAPGSTAEVRIRGFGSVNGNTLPLYIIDGAPVDGNATAVLQSLNPSDVESMVVLKDAAATSIYGSRGANGVILITTKQGKAGVSRISVDVTTSVNTLFLPEYDIVNSPEEYIEISWQALRTKGALLGQADPAAFASNNLYGNGTGETINSAYNIWNAPGNQLINPATGRFNPGVQRKFNPTSWRDAAFGTGVRTEANLQFNGGNEKTTYAVSLGYVDDEGYSINSGYTRYSTRLKLEHKPKDWLTIGGNIAWAGARNTNSGTQGSAGSSANPFALVYTTPAIYDVFFRDPDGVLIPDPIFGGSQYDFGAEYGRRAWNATNGIALALYDLTQSDITTLTGTFNVGVDITDWLKFEMRYSGQYDNRINTNRNNQFYGGAAQSGGSLFRDDDLRTNQNFLQLLRFTKSFGDHDLEVFAAHESTEDRFRTITGAAERAIIPGSNDLNQYTTPLGRAGSFRLGWTLDSYFSGLNYDYADKYFLTASIRRDGSSRFLNNKWGTFGSVGLGWIITKEDFMANVGALDFLKLKASYGVIGDTGTALLNGFQVFGINQDPNGNISYTISSEAANPDLTWETSNVAQVGFESTWFGGRLGVDVDFYDRRTVDLIQIANLAPSSGQETIRYNSGELLNQGLEFNINAKLVEKDNFRLSLNLNGETFKNEVLEMPTDPFSGEKAIFDDFNNIAEGVSQYDWYMREWAGVNPANGEALWYMYYVDENNNGVFDNGELSSFNGGSFDVDVDNDGVNDNASGNLFEYQQLVPGANVRRTTTNNYADATQVFTGKSAIPDVRGGFRINAGFKNLDISAQFSYSIGGYTYDAGYAVLMDNNLIGADNFSTDIRQAWTTPGQVTDVPRTSANFGTDGQQNSFSSRFLTKADFFSLNNVNINYRLSQSIVESMGLEGVSFTLAGDNLMFLSNRKGLNPSTAIGTTNSGIYMPLTTFSLGAKVQF